MFNKREAKESRHRAEPNARRAITRLQYYKSQLFKNQGSPTTNPTPYPERDAWVAPYRVEYTDEQTWDSSHQPPPFGDAGKPAFYPG